MFVPVNWLQARVDVVQSDLHAAEYHFSEVSTAPFLSHYLSQTVINTYLPTLMIESTIELKRKV